MISTQQKLSPKNKRIIVYAIIGIVIFTFASISLGYTENRLVFEGSYIEITGLYGDKVSVADLKSIELTNQKPSLARRTNGISIGDRKKGYFKTRSGEKIKLFINSKNLPLILIEKKNGEKIYFSSNLKSNERIYNELKSNSSGIPNVIL